MIYLIYYIVISYVLGFCLFAHEGGYYLKKRQYGMFGFGIIVLLLSPLTAWHGALHYLQFYYCKLTKRPIKYWI